MTAGMVVLCMPAIATIFRHYRGPVRSFFAKYNTSLKGSWFSTKGTIKQKKFEGCLDGQDGSSPENIHASHDVHAV